MFFDDANELIKKANTINPEPIEIEKFAPDNSILTDFEKSVSKFMPYKSDSIFTLHESADNYNNILKDNIQLLENYINDKLKSIDKNELSKNEYVSNDIPIGTIDSFIATIKKVYMNKININTLNEFLNNATAIIMNDKIKTYRQFIEKVK